jgi:hypothetical protein
MALLILVIAYSGWQWGALAWRQGRTLYWQRQCLSFALPPDQVVYEEDPHEAATLLSTGGAYRSFAAVPPPAVDPSPSTGHLPRCFERFVGTGAFPWIGMNMPVLFMREMKQRNGTSRLVIVCYRADSGRRTYPFYPELELRVLVMAPATLTQLPRNLPWGIAGSWLHSQSQTPRLARFYAGQLDPADPSHFTIRFEMWGQTEVIDGHLLDNSTLQLKVRNQPQPPESRTK